MMDADSGRVCPGRKRFPTSGLGSAAAAPLEPTKRGAGRMLSGAGAARWTRSPRPSNAPAGSGDAKEGTLGVVRSLTTAPKGERASVRPAPGALLFLETHPTLEIQRFPKAKLQAGLQKFGSGLPGFPASSLHSGHQRCRQGQAPLAVAIAAQGHHPRPRGTSLGFLRGKGPSPQPQHQPQRWIRGGGRPGSCRVSVPPPSRSFLQERETWALRES